MNESALHQTAADCAEELPGAQNAAASAWDATRVWNAEVTPLFVRPLLARLP